VTSADDLVRLIDIDAIKQLKARYCRGVDTKEWGVWRTVFADDLRFDTGARIHESADDFVSWVATYLPTGVTTAHQVFNPEITFTGPDAAAGIWAMQDYVRFPSDGLPVGFFGYGHYHEQYVRTPDGWRIRSVVLTRIRVDPLAGGIQPRPPAVTPTSAPTT
jgi:hypothetical protein